MPRKKQTKTDDTPAVTLEGHAVLEALRSNLSLLGELAARYQVDLPARSPRRPTGHQLPPGRLQPAGAGDVGPGPGATPGAAAEHPQ